MIVLKFGGTSVGDAARVRQAAAIIEAQPQPRLAVVSAAAGGTNQLLEAARAVAAGDAAHTATLTAAIRDRHLTIAAAIAVEDERLAAIAELDQLHAALDDALAAVGAAGSLGSPDSDRIVATGE